jgi:short-chain fatty acids transporter
MRTSDRAPLLARAGMRIADACERFFPDAYVFALAAIVVVFAGGLAIGVPARALTMEFGNGFWSLVTFTMQMAMVIIGGFVVASSPPVAALTRRLAAIPTSARGAVAFVAAFAMLSSLISWGLSLIFTGLLVREITKSLEERGVRVDYRAIGAAAYLGLGSVWALGLSSSAALMQATKSSIPPSLLPITGVIPLTQTISCGRTSSPRRCSSASRSPSRFSPRRASVTRGRRARWASRFSRSSSMNTSRRARRARNSNRARC